MSKTICIMTDLEGAAGIASFEDWCVPAGRYHELAREFLAMQVNGAIEGFFEAGATEVIVADGHGPGALHAGLLDERALYQRGWFAGRWPLCVEKGFTALAFVGQHARSRSPQAHLAHTQSFGVLEIRINGVAVGEFGQLAMCASELGVRTILGAGDEAFTKEARQLVPGIETVAVKRGLMSGAGDECPAKSYARHNLSAISLHPRAAAGRIREAAARALKRMDQEDFGIIPLRAPFVFEQWSRATEDSPPTYGRVEHPTSVAGALNLPMEKGPVPEDEHLS
jgi:D-amino peptidase